MKNKKEKTIQRVLLLPLYKLKGVEGVYKKKSMILPLECKKEIASFIEGKSARLDIDPFKKGGLLCEIYYSKHSARLFGQISSCETCCLTPQCELSEITPEKLEILKSFQ